MEITTPNLDGVCLRADHIIDITISIGSLRSPEQSVHRLDHHFVFPVMTRIQVRQNVIKARVSSVFAVLFMPIQELHPSRCAKSSMGINRDTTLPHEELLVVKNPLRIKPNLGEKIFNRHGEL